MPKAENVFFNLNESTARTPKTVKPGRYNHDHLIVISALKHSLPGKSKGVNTQEMSKHGRKMLKQKCLYAGHCPK